MYFYKSKSMCVCMLNYVLCWETKDCALQKFSVEYRTHLQARVVVVATHSLFSVAVERMRPYQHKKIFHGQQHQHPKYSK